MILDVTSREILNAHWHGTSYFQLHRAEVDRREGTIDGTRIAKRTWAQSGWKWTNSMSVVESSVRSKHQEEDYAPLRDYAVIGDCHGSALVHRGGSVDWCCLNRFDADPIFCRLLDHKKGGSFSIAPDAEYAGSRNYIDDTNVLSTTFETSGGKCRLTDFMPVGRRPGAGLHDYVSLNAPGWLVRIVEGVAGVVRLNVKYRPTPGFARRPAELRAAGNAIAMDDGSWLYSDVSLAASGDSAIGAIEVAAGEKRFFIVTDGPAARSMALDEIERLLKATRAFWSEWSRYCFYRGDHPKAALRSALVLKLLTYAPTGAIAAAPTTSLPEAIGGERNWDYRFCWLRDATFSLYALSCIGYSGEARRFGDYLHLIWRKTHPRVQIMYGIDGRQQLDECELDHLAGYRGSRPVRSGNGAFTQTQLDVYGEVLDFAWLYHTVGGRFDADALRTLSALADFVAEHWNEPGQGLWETRGPPRHYLFGKIMSWVAIDRSIRLFGRDPSRVALRDEIARAICQNGIDPRRGYLRIAYDLPRTGTALLLAPVLGLPLPKGTMEATIREVNETLGRGDYLRRYDLDDGLSSEEGAFLTSSFWMVDALLLCGRVDEARELFERLIDAANDVGLYAEEIDPATGAFLGNFPQALTHLALLQSATHLAIFERRGLEAVKGIHADRVHRITGASKGVRGWWAHLVKCKRVGRFWASAESVLDLPA